MQQATANAQQLAKDTVEELKRQNMPGEVPGPPPGAEQQQQQEKQGAEAGSAAPGGTQGEAPGTSGKTSEAGSGVSLVGRLQAFASAAAKEMVLALKVGARLALCPLFPLAASLLFVGLLRQSAQALCVHAGACCHAPTLLPACCPCPPPRMRAQSEQGASALRGASGKAGDVQTAATSALQLSKQQPQQAGWQRQWDDMREKVGRGGVSAGSPCPSDVAPRRRSACPCLRLTPDPAPLPAPPSPPSPPPPPAAAGFPPHLCPGAAWPGLGRGPRVLQGQRGGGDPPRALGDLGLAAGAPHPGVGVGCVGGAQP